MRLVSILIAAAVALAAVPAMAGNPIKGKKVFEDNCVNCHGADGTAIVPGTPNFGRGERMEKPDAMLLNTVRNGSNVMPAWRGIIQDADLLDAIAYVRTLRR